MSFNFDDFLLKGKSAAENVQKNEGEIKEVLEDLKQSLSQFLKIPINFKECIGYVESDVAPIMRLANTFKPRQKSGYNEVYIVSEQVDVSKEIFQLKRSEDIYPITIVMDRNHSVADDQDEFASAIGQIVSSSQFHLQLNSFKRKVQEKLKEKPQRVTKSE